MTSNAWALDSWSKIDDNATVNDASYYGAEFSTPADHGTAHCSVVSQNGDAVSVTSTVNLQYVPYADAGKSRVIFKVLFLLQLRVDVPVAIDWHHT